MNVDFSPEEEEAIRQQIKQALTDANQATILDSEDKAAKAVFDCVADDNLPRHSGLGSYEAASYVDPTLKRVWLWAAKEYFQIRLRELREKKR